MSSQWIDPRYAAVLDVYERSSGKPVVMGACSSCGGSGRIIYHDPASGQMKDMACLSCQGSGQSQ